MHVGTRGQSISYTYYIYCFPNKCFRDVFLAHSWFSQSTVWLRHQVLKSVSSTLGQNVAFPACPSHCHRAAVLPLQIPQHSPVLQGQILFVLLTVPQDLALHLLTHSWMGVHVPSPLCILPKLWRQGSIKSQYQSSDTH